MLCDKFCVLTLFVRSPQKFVRRALDAEAASVEDVGVDHRISLGSGLYFDIKCFSILAGEKDSFSSILPAMRLIRRLIILGIHDKSVHQRTNTHEGQVLHCNIRHLSDIIGRFANRPHREYFHHAASQIHDSSDLPFFPLSAIFHY